MPTQQEQQEQQEEQVVDAEVVDEQEAAEAAAHAAEEASRELVPIAHGAGAIIRADEPDEVIAKATTIANALKRLIDEQKLAANMGGGKKHVEVSAWQACGTMLGALGGTPVHAETVWSRIAREPDGQPVRREYHVQEHRYKGKGKDRQIEKTIEYDVEGYDWEARVEIRTPEGLVVGAAEAMCSRAESTWASRPDPAVKSMAETRAESRAYRRALGWIIAIAGFNPTPKEEMPEQGERVEVVKMPHYLGPPTKKRDEAIDKALGYLYDPTGEDPSIDAAEVAAAIDRLRKRFASEYPKNGGDEGLGHVPIIVADAWIHAAAELKAIADGDNEAGHEAGGKEKVK